MTNRVKRTAVYVRTITRAAERLLENPDLNLCEMSGTKLAVKYGKKADEMAMQATLAHFLLVFPESGFYRRVRYDVDRKLRRYLDQEAFGAAVKTCVEKYRAQLPILLAGRHNHYMSAMCMFMLLPPDVARRFLWHENVDFQSLESFLRRLTREQYASLETHYALSVKEGRPQSELPCYAEGAINKLWGFLKLDSEEEERMAPKSAIAHNFFGFDMGFQLYPSQIHDVQAPRAVARQFLQSKSTYLAAVSTEERGAFEVNKERGGLYWYLYRTLRSNKLYNTGADVRLGTWICPWFWFTMLAWGIFLVASPIALIATIAMATLGSSGLMPLLFTGVLGAITPGLLVLRWAKGKFRHRLYGGNYWEMVGAAIALLVASAFAAGLLILAHPFPAFWALVVSAIFLIPHMVQSNSGRFWELPFLGKALPVTTLILLCNDLYRHTQFWEFLWGLLSWLMLLLFGALWKYRTEIFYTVGGIAVYAGAFWGLLAFEKASERKVDAALNEANAEVNRQDQSVVPSTSLKEVDRAVSLGIQFLALIYALGAAFVLYGVAQTWSMWAVIAIAITCLPFLLPAWASLTGKLGVKHRAIELLMGRAREWLNKGRAKKVRKALSANPFWFDETSFRLNEAELMNIISHADGWYSGWWAIYFLKHISSQVELMRAHAFLLHSPLLREYDIEGNEHVATMILGGATDEAVRAVLEQREALARESDTKMRRLTKVWGDRVEWCADGVAMLIFALWRGLIFVPRMIGRFFYNCYLWWKAMNEACPLSPSHGRGIAE